MKSSIKIILISLFIISILLSLTYILPSRHFKVYTSDELRAEALNRGMRSVPDNYTSLLKLLDTKENKLSKDKIKLGEKLFFDTLLSKDNTISCASCHILNEGGDDNKPTAIGYHKRQNPFHLNSPTVLNASLQKFQFWDGNAKSVEEQAKGPIQAPFEMNMLKNDLINKIKNNKKYKKLFKEVFENNNSITFNNITKAIGAYEKTLLTRGAYDEFLDGNNSAINKKAKKGLANFINFGCKGCHTGISVGGQSIQRFPLRKFASIYDLRVNLEIKPKYKIINNKFPFENIGGFLGKSNTQFFKVPSLRNINKTSPYFHNGVVKKLKDVVKIMAIHQLGMNLTKIQIDEIVEFLKTLDGNIVKYEIK